MFSITVSLHSNNIDIDARWIQNGITVAGGNGRGNGLNQLTSPVGLYVDDDQTIYASDYEHHRIMKWKYGATSGQIVAGGNGVGNRNNQLNGPTDLIIDKKSDCLLICDSGNRRVMRWPRRNGTIGEIIIAGIRCSGLTMDNNEYLYVSDYEKHEVRRWRLGDTHGTVVAGGNGQGYRLDQLNVPTRVFVDHDYSVYVSDSGNHRVMKWIKDAKEGIVVAGGQNQGDSLTQLSQPQGVIVDRFSTVYVSDWNNHRIMRWVKGATKGCIVVGKNGKSKQANQLDYPVSLSFDQQNNLYIADRNNNRVQKFEIESS
ncbi:unnamed protein product [Rotaria sp. Silwood1]|nr:unnamed protein product [Rotaria sp. Silwood1]CAF4943183.1 unnamed protein product [Rotaria sp. Silwood1]